MEKRKIAVIGAGFAGLATAHALADYSDLEVHLFDECPIDGGASGAAVGLMHPYPPQRRRKHLLYGFEAFEEAKELIKSCGEGLLSEAGLIRLYDETELADHFAELTTDDPHIEPLSDLRFMVKNGCVVQCKPYLRALLKKCIDKGVQFKEKRVTSHTEVAHFDVVIEAKGREMLDCALPLRAVKGQALKIKLEKPPTMALMGKGYLAPTDEEGVFQLGSTYERGVLDPIPNLETAKRELFPKLEKFDLPEQKVEILNNSAGIRVGQRSHYFPLVKRSEGNMWTFTGMGSRGLLYHAFLGKKLAKAVHANDEKWLPTID